MMQSLSWIGLFPELEALEESAKKLLTQYARIVEAPIGTIGYREGDHCSGYVLRLKGRSRVYKMSASGREIVLYRVSAGETCVITTTCLLGNSQEGARQSLPGRSVVQECTICSKNRVKCSEMFRNVLKCSRMFPGRTWCNELLWRVWGDNVRKVPFSRVFLFCEIWCIAKLLHIFGLVWDDDMRWWVLRLLKYKIRWV